MSPTRFRSSAIRSAPFFFFHLHGYDPLLEPPTRTTWRMKRNPTRQVFPKTRNTRRLTGSHDARRDARQASDPLACYAEIQEPTIRFSILRVVVSFFFLLLFEKTDPGASCLTRDEIHRFGWDHPPCTERIACMLDGLRTRVYGPPSLTKDTELKGGSRQGTRLFFEEAGFLLPDRCPRR